MSETQIRRAVRQFIKACCNGKSDYCSLCRGVEKLGYTVIGFNHIYNDTDVLTLVTELKLTEQIQHANGFTYADRDYRLVFIHEDLAEAEKRMVLAHEAGHICLEHMLGTSVLGRDVRQEFEANEFAHCLLSGTWGWGILFRNKALVGALAAVLVLVMGCAVLLTVYLQSLKHYYATESGDKYHEKECISIKNNESVRELTAEELASGAYESCHICLP